MIGGAGFRTAAKDILLLSLNEWIQNNETQSVFSNLISNGASENSETAITETNKSNESSNKKSETNKESAENVSNALESIQKDDSNGSTLVKAKDTLESVKEDVVKDEIENLSTTTNDNSFNEINEDVKEYFSESNDEKSKISETKEEINDSLNQALKEQNVSTSTDKTAKEIQEVIITGISNDIILGDKDIKTIAQDNVALRAKLMSESAASNTQFNFTEIAKIEQGAEERKIQLLEKFGSSTGSKLDTIVSLPKIQQPLIKNAPPPPLLLSKTFNTSLQKEEKNAPKGNSILTKFNGLLTKSKDKLGNKIINKRTITTGIKAAGKAMEMTGKGLKAAAPMIKATGAALGKGTETVGRGVTRIGMSLAGSKVGAIFSPLFLGAGGLLQGAGKGIKTGSAAAGAGMRKAGSGMEKQGKFIQKNAKNIANAMFASKTNNSRINPKGKDKSNDPKFSLLNKIALATQGTLFLQRKSNQDKINEAIKNKQFGKAKGGSKSNGTFNFSNLTKTLKNTFKKLPGAIGSALSKAKAKVILMLIGLVVGLGTIIYMFFKNPALMKKIERLIGKAFAFIWKVISGFVQKISPKVLAIVAIAMGLIGLMYFGPWGLLLAAVPVIIRLWKTWYPVILSLLIGAAALWLFGPWGFIVGAVVLLGSLIFKFKDKIWAFVKGLGKFLLNMMFFPYKLLFGALFKFFPGLKEKIANLNKKIGQAIMGFLRKIPFIGRFFGGKDEEGDKAKKAVEEEKKETNKIKPPEKPKVKTENKPKEIKKEYKQKTTQKEQYKIEKIERKNNNTNVVIKNNTPKEQAQKVSNVNNISSNKLATAITDSGMLVKNGKITNIIIMPAPIMMVPLLVAKFAPLIFNKLRGVLSKLPFIGKFFRKKNTPKSNNVKPENVNKESFNKNINNVKPDEKVHIAMSKAVFNEIANNIKAIEGKETINKNAINESLEKNNNQIEKTLTTKNADKLTSKFKTFKTIGTIGKTIASVSPIGLAAKGVSNILFKGSNKNEQLINALPKAIVLGLSTYFDNKALKVIGNEQKINALTIKKEDRDESVS